MRLSQWLLPDSLQSLGTYGVFVLAWTFCHLARGTVPESATMGGVALLALLINVTVAVLLYTFREGDANMRSVWLCSRNDAFGNIAIMLTALGVIGSGKGWPDILVAALMGCLGLTAAMTVVTQFRQDIRNTALAKENA